MKFKIVMSMALALLIAGCGANDNNDGATNLGLNQPNKTNYDNTMNVSNVRNTTRDVEDRYYNDNDFRVSEDVANRVAGLKEVKSATVLLTDHRAYVAAVLNDDEGGDVSPRVEKKIADTVRGVDQSIQRVYVSTNPDFIDRVEQYADDVSNGRPISGFGAEFSELVNRIFPNAR